MTDPCPIDRLALHAVLGDSKVCRHCGKSLGKQALREARERRARAAVAPPERSMTPMQRAYAEHYAANLAERRQAGGDTLSIGVDFAKDGTDHTVIVRHASEAAPTQAAVGPAPAAPVPAAPVPAAPPFRRLRPANYFGLFTALALAMIPPDPPPLLRRKDDLTDDE